MYHAKKCRPSHVTALDSRDRAPNDLSYDAAERSSRPARALVPALAARELSTIAARQVPPKRSRISIGPEFFERRAAAPVWRPPGEFRVVFPHHRNPRRGLCRQRVGLRGAWRTPVDHRLHAGAGAGCDCLGRRSAARVPSSSLAPRETARAVAGGWRLSGRFPFSSGCLHSAMGDHRRALRGWVRRPADSLPARAHAARSKSSTTGRFWDCAAPAAGRYF
jgi:hypothetical protein